jgi:hypothetical protein
VTFITSTKNIPKIYLVQRTKRRTCRRSNYPALALYQFNEGAARDATQLGGDATKQRPYGQHSKLAAYAR